MKLLPIAFTGLIASLLFQCHSEAQVRLGRGGGISINIPLGGRGPSYAPRGYGSYGYGSRGYSSFGYSSRGYGGYGYRYGGYGPHVGIPIYPVPSYRVPAYRVPIYSPYTPRYSTFSLRIEPRRTYVAPRPTYVYPQPYADQFDEAAGSYGSDLGRVYGNYQSARPVAPTIMPDDFSKGVNDETSLLQSAELLRESLSRRRDDADIWLDYLNPDLIIDVVQSGGDGAVLQELLKNYDGLSGNADLSNLWVEPGFRRTHQGLRSYIENSISSVPAQPGNQPGTQMDNQMDTQANAQPDTLLSTPLSAQRQSPPVATPIADPLTDSEPESQLDAVEELPTPAADPEL